jgi:hypothetical protein
MVGVVLGGLLAIPVTLAILLFGFQRDPLHVTPKVPDGLRFLLPSRFRSAGMDRRTDQTIFGPGRLTLDQIPTPDTAAAAADEPDPGPGVPPAPAPTIVDEGELGGEAIVPPSAAPTADIGGAGSGLPASPPPHPIDEVELVVDLVEVRVGLLPAFGLLLDLRLNSTVDCCGLHDHNVLHAQHAVNKFFQPTGPGAGGKMAKTMNDGPV